MACTGTRGKSGRRPPWTEPVARPGKLGKTTYMSPTRTRTHNGRYGDTGKKVADAHRARNWTRDMQNWAKPRTGNAHEHGPVIGLYGKTGKKCPSPVVAGTGRAPCKTGQNNIGATYAYTDQQRAVRGHGKKVAGARRGRNWTHAMENWAKQRTTHTHVQGPKMGTRGPGKKGPFAMETDSIVANDGQETVPWQRKHVSWQKNAAKAAFEKSVPLLHKLKGRGPNGGYNPRV